MLLIVEVAASSLRFDRKTKLPLYARHGIPEMWLVDLGGRRLVRYRAPQDGSYTLVDEPDLGTALEVSALSGNRCRPAPAVWLTCGLLDRLELEQRAVALVRQHVQQSVRALLDVANALPQILEQRLAPNLLPLLR